MTEAGRASDVRWFFVVAFVWTWTAWVPAGLSERGIFDLPVPMLLLMLIGGLGPMAAAIIMTAARQGGRGLGDLFGQLRPSRTGRRWYVRAIGIGLLSVVPALVFLAFGGVTSGSEVAGYLAVLPLHLIAVAIVGGGLDEELGWRGYALPRLQGLLHPVTANLILGGIWAAWHLPLWLVPGSNQASTPFAIYLVTTLAQSFLLAWLYNASRRGLLVVILAHSMANVMDNLRNTILGSNGDLFPTELVLMAVMVTAAVVATVATRGRLGLAPDPGQPEDGVARVDAVTA